MTAKLKAIQLVNSFDELGRDFTRGVSMKEFSKQCALLAVDEIDAIYQKLTPKDDPYYFLLELEYWQEIKTEIEKL